MLIFHCAIGLNGFVCLCLRMRTDQAQRPQQAAWETSGRPGVTFLSGKVAGKRVQAGGAVQTHNVQHAQ